MPGDATTSYTYNELGRLASISHQSANLDEMYRYAYDLAGNKISADKHRVGADVDTGSFAYTYDAMNRLAQVQKDGALLRAYSYDAFGNRTRKEDYIGNLSGNVTGGTPIITAYQYNTKNQLISEADGLTEKHYEYDHRGNLTSVRDGAALLKQFTFDVANQMSASYGSVNGVQKQASYTYNGLGHRVGQDIWQVNGAGMMPNVPENPEQKIRYTLDLTRQYNNLLERTTSDALTSSDMSQSFFWDSNVVGMDEAGRKSFYMQDDLGSTMQLMDEEGYVRESYAYDEFGVGVHSSEVYTARDIFTNPLQPFGYTGYQMDTVGSLYFAQARRYDAGVGRFVSEDMVKGSILAPFTMNHYGYCWNRPMDLVDLNGMWPSLSDIGDFISEHKEAIIATTVAVIAVVAIATVTVATGGLAGPVIAGALVGAGISATSTVAEQVAVGGWENVDVDKVIISAATGSVSGALMGSTAGMGTSILGNGIISASGSVATDMVDYNRGEDISGGDIAFNAALNGAIGAGAGWFGGTGAQYGSYRSTTVTSILFDGTHVQGTSGITKQLYYDSYRNMLQNNFKVGAVKTAISTAGITVKNILASENEGDCSKEGSENAR